MNCVKCVNVPIIHNRLSVVPSTVCTFQLQAHTVDLYQMYSYSQSCLRLRVQEVQVAQVGLQGLNVLPLSLPRDAKKKIYFYLLVHKKTLKKCIFPVCLIMFCLQTLKGLLFSCFKHVLPKFWSTMIFHLQDYFNLTIKVMTINANAHDSHIV